MSFNPPPPFQAREPLVEDKKDDPEVFQSTPAFSGEGTPGRYRPLDGGTVSIHPRLFRRGNPHSAPPLTVRASFNPPPPFQARELDIPQPPPVTSSFQSTPAFSGEGTDEASLDIVWGCVSIHPRLFRRGNSRTWTAMQMLSSFNPPPPFQAREPCPHRHVTAATRVSIHPRLFRRGNAKIADDRGLFEVSIHPRLFRRGNHPAASQ